MLDVRREYITNGGGRIDIVIFASAYRVAIENKIRHWVANDLHDYWATIDVPGMTSIGIVLSPQHETLTGTNFTSITYADFIRQVQVNLGGYAFDGDPEYLSMLIGFLRTMENLMKGGAPMDPQLFRFMNYNHGLIQTLIDGYRQFGEELARNVELVLQHLKPRPQGVEPWINERTALVIEFSVLGQAMAIESLLSSPDGWQITVFGRVKTRSDIIQLSDVSPQTALGFLTEEERGSPNWNVDKDRVIFRKSQTLPITSSSEEVADVIDHLLDRINEYKTCVEQPKHQL